MVTLMPKVSGLLKEVRFILNSSTAEVYMGKKIVFQNRSLKTKFVNKWDDFLTKKAMLLLSLL